MRTLNFKNSAATKRPKKLLCEWKKINRISCKSFINLNLLAEGIISRFWGELNGAKRNGEL